MATYRIRPITLARQKADKGPMTYLVHYGETIWRPYIFWIVEGAKQNILVDTAIEAADYRSYQPAFRDLSIEHLLTFEEGLAKASLTPADVDIVIQTHLHFDHSYNTFKCDNAKVIVQEKELRYARDPHSVFRSMYARALLEGLDFMTVDGQKEILPGIELIPAPGHTPGCQAVSIRTEAGRAVISGFCCVRENFYPSADIHKTDSPFAGAEVIIPGIHHDAAQAYDSIVKIKELADIVLPVHEPDLMGVESIP